MLEAVLNFFKKFFLLDVSVFVCALGDFLVLFAPVLRQKRHSCRSGTNQESKSCGTATRKR